MSLHGQPLSEDVTQGSVVDSKQADSLRSGPGIQLMDLHMLIATEGIRGIELPDTVLIEAGSCNGLLRYNKVDKVVNYDPNWPHVEASHQVRGGLFTIKKSTETVAKNELVVNHFAGPPVKHGASSPPKSGGGGENALTVSQTTSALNVSNANNTSSGTSTPCENPRARPCAMVIRDVSGTSGMLQQAAADPALEIEVSYITPERLSDVVNDFSLDDSSCGFLMRYTAPPNNRHNMVRCIFTPYVTKVELHECTMPLDDERVPLASRTSTNRKANIRTKKPSKSLEVSVNRVCNALYEFFKEKDIALNQCVLYFFEVSPGRIQLLWCSQMTLRPWEGPKDDHRKHQAETEEKKTAEPQPPPPTPISHQESTEQQINMVDSIRDFGFYSGDSEKINNALKRQVQTVSRVENFPKELVVDDTPPYDAKFIEALANPAVGDVYFRKQRAREMQQLSPNALERQGTMLASRKSFMLSPSIQDAVEQLDKNYKRAGGATTSAASPSKGSGGAGGRKNSSVSILSPDASPLGRVLSGTLRRSTSSMAPRGASPTPSQPQQQHPPTGFDVCSSTSQASHSHICSSSNVNVQFPDEHSICSFSEAVSEEDDGDDPYQQLASSAPDPRHMGHIRRLRAKYKNKEMAGFEAEAEFKSQVLQAHAHRRAKTAMAERVEEQKANRRRRKSSLPFAEFSHTTLPSPHIGGVGHKPTSVSAIFSPSKSVMSNRSTGSAKGSKRYTPDSGLWSLRATTTEPSFTNPKPWLGATHVDYNTKTPFRRMSTYIPARANETVKEEIPKYSSELADASLGGYVVGTDLLDERPPEEQPRLLTDEEIHKAARWKVVKDRVPEPPIVVTGNTHMSLSEEIMQARKVRGFKSRDTLEMLFHDDGEDFSKFARPGKSGGGLLRKASKATTMSSATDFFRAGGGSSRASTVNNDDAANFEDFADEQESTNSAAFQKELQQRLVEEQNHQKELQREQERSHEVMLAKFGALEAKESVQSLLHAFEDLMYQQKSQDKKKIGSQKSPELIIRIPSHYASMHNELRALLIGIGFKERNFQPPAVLASPAVAGTPMTERSVSLRDASPRTTKSRSQSFIAKTLADILADEPDEAEEKLPAKEYVLPNNSVMISQVHARADTYSMDVASLFADSEWSTLQKIRHLVEHEGYTFFDAVSGVKKNLMKRATIAKKRSIPLFDMSRSGSPGASFIEFE